MEAALDVEIPTAQFGSSPTNQVPEEISALTTYSYNMDTSHNQMANPRKNNATGDMDYHVRVVKTLQSNMDKMLIAKDKKYSKLDEKMETFAEMVIQNIEAQDQKFEELKEAIKSSKSQSSHTSDLLRGNLKYVSPKYARPTYDLSSKFNNVTGNLERSRHGSPCYLNASQSQYDKNTYLPSTIPQDDAAYDLSDDDEKDYLFKSACSADPSRPTNYMPPSDHHIKEYLKYIQDGTEVDNLSVEDLCKLDQATNRSADNELLRNLTGKSDPNPSAKPIATHSTGQGSTPHTAPFFSDHSAPPTELPSRPDTAPPTISSDATPKNGNLTPYSDCNVPPISKTGWKEGFDG